MKSLALIFTIVTIAACHQQGSTGFVSLPIPAMAAAEVVCKKEEVAANDAKKARPVVVGMHVFYNDSFYDGNDSALNEKDDLSLDPTKQPLFQGQTATGFNVTNEGKGITGLMIDFKVDPADQSAFSPTVDDFQIRIGKTFWTSGWVDGPRPDAIAIRKVSDAIANRRKVIEAGVEIMRVSLSFPAGAIKNTYVEVTVRATQTTGLTAPKVAGVFGNLAGDANLRPEYYARYHDVPGAITLGVLAVVEGDLNLVSSQFGTNVDGPLSALIKINRSSITFNITDVTLIAQNIGQALELIKLLP